MLQQLSLLGYFWKTVQLISKQSRVGRCYHMLVIKRMLRSSIILTGIPFVVRGGNFCSNLSWAERCILPLSWSSVRPAIEGQLCSVCELAVVGVDASCFLHKLR